MPIARRGPEHSAIAMLVERTLKVDLVGCKTWFVKYPSKPEGRFDIPEGRRSYASALREANALGSGYPISAHMNAIKISRDRVPVRKDESIVFDSITL